MNFHLLWGYLECNPSDKWRTTTVFTVVPYTVPKWKLAPHVFFKLCSEHKGTGDLTEGTFHSLLSLCDLTISTTKKEWIDVFIKPSLINICTVLQFVMLTHCETSFFPFSAKISLPQNPTSFISAWNVSMNFTSVISFKQEQVCFISQRYITSTMMVSARTLNISPWPKLFFSYWFKKKKILLGAAHITSLTFLVHEHIPEC